MMVCTVLICFILTVLQESSNLDAIFIVCRKIKNKIREGSFKKKNHIWAAIPSSGPPPPPPYLGHP